MRGTPRPLIIIAGNMHMARWVRDEYRRISHAFPWRRVRLLTARCVRDGGLRGYNHAAIWLHTDSLFRFAQGSDLTALSRDLAVFDYCPGVDVVRL